MTPLVKYLAIAGSTLTVGISLLLGTVAGAVESHGIGAVPAHPRADNPRSSSIFVYEIKPGSDIQDAIKVVNNTDTKRNIKIYPVDSQHSSDGAFACAQAADKQAAVGTWIKLASERITLEPMSNEVVPFTLQVPQSADSGEHNGCIAVQEDLPPQESSTNGIVLSFRSAIRVAITVPGAIHAKVSFLDIYSEVARDKLRLSPVLKNDGNVSVDADLSVGLKNILGMQVASASGKFSLLKSEESRFNFEVEDPFWGGWYQKVGSINYVPLRENTADQGAKQFAGAQSEWVYINPQPAAALIEIIAVLGIAGGIAYYLWNRQQHRLLATRTTDYRVQPGDNLQALAAGANISWQKLAKLNDLKPPYSLTTGQTIRLPKHSARNKSTTKTV